MKRISKSRSYLRWVLIVFSFVATFYLFQMAVLYMGITRYIFPRYLEERRDILIHVREDIIHAVKENPKFSLDAYIVRQNRIFQRGELGFIPKEEAVVKEIGGNTALQLKKAHQPPWLGTVPLRAGHYDGYLYFDTRGFSRIHDRMALFPFFMVLTLIVSLIGGFIIFKRVYRRFSLLLDGVERLSAGDYSARVDIRGEDEFHLVGEAFNGMAGSIERFIAELKAVDRQRREFIAEISHELSTPLTSAKGYMETLLMEDIQLSREERQAYLKIAWDETERLSLLVRDLLELARMDAGTISLEKTGIDGFQFIQAFLRRNTLRLNEKKVSLVWEIESGLTLWADYRRLEQILQNLLDNTLKHSQGVTHISIDMRKENGKTVVIFADNGSGIAEEHLERIFQRFYRVNTNLDSASGLGLTIVKGLVELHGGTIGVAAGAEKGTLFTMDFPDPADI